jgi:hypothetical protein
MMSILGWRGIEMTKNNETAIMNTAYEWEVDPYFKVLRTNRLKSKCAVSERFWRGRNALSETVSAAFNRWGASAQSCFNSLTRRLFVSNSHVGRMSTQYYIF